MSETFTASNGIQVAWLPVDGAEVLCVDSDDCTTAVPSTIGWHVIGTQTQKEERPGFAKDSAVAVALREFFQHERDKELGRWRWPEDHNLVVVPNDKYHDDGKRWVYVYDERKMGTGSWYCSDSSNPGKRGRQPLHDAAHDYFAAHPESKPWHDAKPGEVWVIEWEDPAFAGEEGTAIIVPSSGWDLHLAAKSARRIWPEVSDGA